MPTTEQPSRRHTHRYYDLILVAFVTVLLCSNLIGAGKATQIDLPVLGSVVFSAGVIFFPISYMFGDILTEVYGYAYDRRAVWCGFGAILFAAIMSLAVISMPTAPGDYNTSLQKGLETVFGNTWRIVAGSVIAFWSGGLVNSFVMAKMKIMTSGKHLWARMLGSTAAGELIDSSLFYFIAFYGIWPTEQVISVAIAQYILKSSWELVAMPFSYRFIHFLKRKENQDYYDYHTNFSPFKLKV
ncbi:queuosine precursor transporter [Orrella sp. NBD-18]|uniref:Probable queuosine precursor transporter n=1 Tax=Sheuella amnicola TaxID=2707330 RepID=A0A6B2R7U6_9BURK|nr:queuosine precursor transporter [Sheuella amnicola]NDY83365.1 queuosine precursor transporter [Sheuella amnicola]HBI83749.1 hypothetical protein [Alcaligenaceae bacterium]